MALSARERFPTGASAYAEAYNAVEVSARKAQALLDALWETVLALAEPGMTHGRGDAWKVARIVELGAPRTSNGELPLPVSVNRMPTAGQMLDAIADWRKKRGYLDYLWSRLPAEVQANAKPPETLD
jgi:hypothetical protein